MQEAEKVTELFRGLGTVHTGLEIVQELRTPLVHGLGTLLTALLEVRIGIVRPPVRV